MILFAVSPGLAFVAGLVIGVVFCMVLIGVFAPDPYVLRDDALRRVAHETTSDDEREAIVKIWGDLGYPNGQ